MRGRRPVRGTAGQGLVEFASVLALVALAVIAALILLGSDLSSVLANLDDLLPP